MPWNPGDQITLRWVGHRAWLDEKAELERGTPREIPGLLQGWPHVVVEDTPDLLALWMPAGTTTQLIDLADRSKPAIPSVWRRDTLRLMFPGKLYSIALNWTSDPDREWPEKPRQIFAANEGAPALYAQQTLRPFAGVPAHTFLHWYVNLEAPFIRTSVGVDSTDGALDVVVDPDLTWHWKDEETMPVLVDLGIYRQQDVDDFYAAGREAIALIESRRFPFDGAYLDWLAPKEWPIPEAQPGWDRVPGYNLNITTGRYIAVDTAVS